MRALQSIEMITNKVILPSSVNYYFNIIVFFPFSLI